jgi:hypothetical protein
MRILTRRCIMGVTVNLKHVGSIGVLCIMLSACSVTQTVEDILSSTTPSDVFTGDGVLKADQRVNAFVALNFEYVKQDMARGHGEYLASLSTLMGVTPERQTDFFAYAQSRYPFVQQGNGPADVLALLTRTPRQPTQAMTDARSL